MKSRKLIGVYTGLLIIAVATMIMLWRLKTMPKAEVFPRDYPEIKEEGILRLVTEYNQSGYYVAGDTIEGFQYELSQGYRPIIRSGNTDIFGDEPGRKLRYA